MKEIALCSRCHSLYEKGRGALSRRDNKTEICSRCGMLEAYEDYMKAHANIKKGK